MDEPRLVLPFIDKDGMLFGFTGRSFKKNSLRYLTIMIDDTKPKIFGLDKVDFNRKYYVVEGPIDSLFLDNAIAVSGTSFGKLSETGLDKDNLNIVFDNQPRNVEVCKLIEKNIDQGYSVVIWPQTIIAKDINETINVPIIRSIAFLLE